MAFDIYGNNLRSGHCEVHPGVHEEYPCSMCYMENEMQRQVQQQPDERDFAIDCLKDRIKVLEDALQIIGHGNYLPPFDDMKGVPQDEIPIKLLELVGKIAREALTDKDKP